MAKIKAVKTTWADRQIAKGVKLELTQRKARNEWRKMINGKLRYLKYPITKEGYESALLEWAQIKAQIDFKRPYASLIHHHKDIFLPVQNYFDSHGAEIETEKKTAKQVDQFLGWLDELLLNPSMLPQKELSDVPDWFETQLELEEFCFAKAAFKYLQNKNAFKKSFFVGSIKENQKQFGSLAFDLPRDWIERIDSLETRKAKKLPQTVGYWIDDYLKQKGVKALNRQLRNKTIMDAKEKIKKFRLFIGEKTLVVDITTETIKSFYAHLIQQPFNNKRGYFNAMKSFIKYAWMDDACHLEKLPKNIDAKEIFSFRSATKKQKVSKLSKLWTKADFKKVLKKDSTLPERYQCWILLMLNCGFTQTDLNDLKRDEIHVKEKRIVKVRTKAENYDDPPIVNYKLWDITFELLHREMDKHDHPEFALFATKGARVINEKIGTDPITGEIVASRSDNITRQWQNIRNDAGLTGKQLKFIRKTGSTTIKSKLKFITLDQLYLGHTPSTVADKNYNIYEGQVYKPLDEAIAWMGKQFGIK